MIQNLRKLREVIDCDRVTGPILRVLQNLWDSGILFHELNCEASRDLRDFMNSVIERILLNRQTKELMGEKTLGPDKSRLSQVKIGNYSASKVLLP